MIESIESSIKYRRVGDGVALAELMLLPEGETLATILSPKELATVKDFYAPAADSLSSFLKYRPYVLAMSLSYSSCEVVRLALGIDSLDTAIAARGKAAGARLLGLETVPEQYESMAAMPTPEQIGWLMQAIAEAPNIDHIVETMIRLYLAQDTGMLLAWSRQMTVEHGNEATWASFKSLLIDARNERMAERAAPHINDGNAFIAVGALHLPGENGLVELLRKAGYKVTPVK